ncbi:hypothetical protein TWF718_009666 [Orbilia javanica]|uniref:Uncharacterized protein n=1 Tax=Orbilia javanica TaxID=47235 RepID=A0AAN8NQU9_9PEZI
MIVTVAVTAAQVPVLELEVVLDETSVRVVQAEWTAVVRRAADVTELVNFWLLSAVFVVEVGVSLIGGLVVVGLIVEMLDAGLVVLSLGSELGGADGEAGLLLGV